MLIDFSQQTGKKITTRGTKKICICIENILYIQCSGDFSTIFLENKIQVSEIKTLKAYEEEFCGMGFIRISRNRLVNGKHITNVNTNYKKRTVYLGDIELTVSKRRLQVLRKEIF